MSSAASPPSFSSGTLKAMPCVDPASRLWVSRGSYLRLLMDRPRAGVTSSLPKLLLSTSVSKDPLEPLEPLLRRIESSLPKVESAIVLLTMRVGWLYAQRPRMIWGQNAQVVYRYAEIR